MAKACLYAFADEADKLIVNQIDALLGNKIDFLEIRGVDGMNIADVTLEKAEELKALFDKSGIKVWSIGSPIGKCKISDDFSIELARFKHVLEIARILDIGLPLVKYRIRRAKELLEQLLGKEDAT